jgi:hypothetical protein
VLEENSIENNQTAKSITREGKNFRIDICRTEALNVLDGNEKITSSFQNLFSFSFSSLLANEGLEINKLQVLERS